MRSCPKGSVVRDPDAFLPEGSRIEGGCKRGSPSALFRRREREPVRRPEAGAIPTGDRWGQEQIELRNLRVLRWRTAAIGAALLFVAKTARAAEGGLEIIPDPSVLVPLMIGFAILVPLINQLLLRPLLRVLDARDEQITGSRQRAERIAAEAEEIASRYGRAVEGVRTEAEQQRQAALSVARDEETGSVRAARDEAEGRLDAARSEIGSALQAARESLRSSAEALAREAAQQILGRRFR
jgi:F-type H+-transporting ATPase subunit b